jgi:hypothetical protein
MDIIEAISRFMGSGIGWARQVPWLKPELRLAQAVTGTPQAAAQGVVRGRQAVVMFLPVAVVLIVVWAWVIWV